jgi:hypothetical protein
MTKAIALARSLESHALEAVRIVLVSGCAVALIAAGRALPV